MELSDIGELGELQALEAELAELLAEEDVVNLAAAMEPGSTAGVLIWENLWAAPFASAARRSGGQLIANGRIPIQAIIASIEADEAASRSKETEHAPQTSTCRTSRCHRRAGGEDRGRRHSRHTRPLAGRQDRGRRRGGHAGPAAGGSERPPYPADGASHAGIVPGVALEPAFRRAVGETLAADAVISEPEQLRTYECDALTGHRAVPELVVLPGSAAEVQAVVRLCARARRAVRRARRGDGALRRRAAGRGRRRHLARAAGPHPRGRPRARRASSSSRA